MNPVDKLKALSKTPHGEEATSEEPSANAVTTQPAVEGVVKLKAVAKTLKVKSTAENPAAVQAGTERAVVDDEKVKTTTATPGTTAHVVNLSLEKSGETRPATQGVTRPARQAVRLVKKNSRGSGSRRSLAAWLWTIVWWCLRFSCRIIYGLCKVPLWTIPKYAYQRYRRISSRKMRLSIAISALLVTGVGAFFIWPELEQMNFSEWKRDVRSEPGGDVRSDPGGDVRSDPALEAQSEPRTEVCEFLARPAARLFIDGKLASEEVPPIYRTELEIGEHIIRFVSTANRTNEIRIDVVEDLPTRWFMNWVEDQVDERPLQSDEDVE